MTPVAIEAEIGVRRLHAQCADAVWRRDGRAFAACHSDDALWRIAGMEIRGREAIASALDAFGAGNERVLMTFGAPILAFDRGVLTGRTHVLEHIKLLDGGASTSIGFYYERFVEREGQWLFQWRHFDFAYLGPCDLTGPYYSISDYGAPPGMPDAQVVTSGPHVGIRRA